MKIALGVPIEIGLRQLGVVRGYLLPRLLAVLRPVPAALTVGAIWGLWHAPLILLDGYNYPSHRALGVIMMIALCAGVSVILSWLRLASGSVRPAAVAHGALNAQAGVALIMLTPERAMALAGFRRAWTGYEASNA